MANPLTTGGDFEGYEDFCDTLANLMKNNWRSSDPISGFSGLQPGMIVSDSDDEKLHHITDVSGGSDLVLQETMNPDAEPIFAKLALTVYVSNISNPPTDAELDALFTNPGTFGNDKFAFIRDEAAGTKIYLIMANDGEWFASELTQCV